MGITVDNILAINLGNVGHCSDKFQKLFDQFDKDPGDSGYFLRFEDHNYHGNKYVMAITNCFEDEEHFLERLNLKLLYYFAGKI